MRVWDRAMCEDFTLNGMRRGTVGCDIPEVIPAISQAGQSARIRSPMSLESQRGQKDVINRRDYYRTCHQLNYRQVW